MTDQEVAWDGIVDSKQGSPLWVWGQCSRSLDVYYGASFSVVSVDHVKKILTLVGRTGRLYRVGQDKVFEFGLRPSKPPVESGR